MERWKEDGDDYELAGKDDRDGLEVESHTCKALAN